jgi:hypothetical protein
MIERPHQLVIPVSPDELAQIHALAEDGDEPATHLVRRMLKAEYRRRFGDAAPPPLTLKFERRRSAKRRATRPNTSTKGTA